MDFKEFEDRLNKARDYHYKAKQTVYVLNNLLGSINSDHKYSLDSIYNSIYKYVSGSLSELNPFELTIIKSLLGQQESDQVQVFIDKFSKMKNPKVRKVTAKYFKQVTDDITPSKTNKFELGVIDKEVYPLIRGVITEDGYQYEYLFLFKHKGKYYEYIEVEPYNG